MVSLSGYDVWLISTRQNLAPDEFVVPFTEEAGSLDAFLIDRTAPPLGLSLDRTGKPGGEQPCVFLMRLGGGNDRCGIYSERPAVCAAYPMSMWSGIVFERDDPLCPPGSWPVEQVEMPSWRRAMHLQQMHFDVYCEVVARWNAHVRAEPPTTIFDLQQYYGYLANVYDRLAKMDAQLGEQALAGVQAGWPTLPREALTHDEKADEPPWFAYLSRARRLIDELYPGLPALPLLALDEASWTRSFGHGSWDQAE